MWEKKNNLISSKWYKRKRVSFRLFYFIIRRVYLFLCLILFLIIEFNFEISQLILSFVIFRYCLCLCFFNNRFYIEFGRIFPISSAIFFFLYYIVKGLFLIIFDYFLEFYLVFMSENYFYGSIFFIENFLNNLICQWRNFFLGNSYY